MVSLGIVLFWLSFLSHCSCFSRVPFRRQLYIFCFRYSLRRFSWLNKWKNLFLKSDNCTWTFLKANTHRRLNSYRTRRYSCWRHNFDERKIGQLHWFCLATSLPSGKDTFLGNYGRVHFYSRLWRLPLYLKNVGKALKPTVCHSSKDYRKKYFIYFFSKIQ